MFNKSSNFEVLYLNNSYVFYSKNVFNKSFTYFIFLKICNSIIYKIEGLRFN